MSESYTLFDNTDDSMDKKKIETDKEKLINALEVDEKMSSVQAPNNIVEYMHLAEEEEELAEVQPQEPKPEPTTSAPSLDTKEDKRLANMKTVIKRFDDIENKLNQILNYKQCRECGGKVINE